jgi:hypothetical protein
MGTISAITGLVIGLSLVVISLWRAIRRSARRAEAHLAITRRHHERARRRAAEDARLDELVARHADLDDPKALDRILNDIAAPGMDAEAEARQALERRSAEAAMEMFETN